MELFELSQVTDVKPLLIKEHQEVIVFKLRYKELGLMVPPPMDTLETAIDMDESTLF